MTDAEFVALGRAYRDAVRELEAAPTLDEGRLGVLARFEAVAEQALHDACMALGNVPQWTQETPTEPDLYLWLTDGDEYPKAVHVVCLMGRWRVFHIGEPHGTDLANCSGWWCRIAVPPLPVPEPSAC